MVESPKPLKAVFVLHDAPIAFLDYVIDTVQVGLAESHAIITDQPLESANRLNPCAGSPPPWRGFCLRGARRGDGCSQNLYVPL